MDHLRLIAALAAGVLIGCASGHRAVSPPAPTPTEKLAEALGAAAEMGTHVLRYNPAACACPRWEVRVGARWVRVDLRQEEGAEPGPVDALNTSAQRRAEEAGARAFVAQGSLGVRPWLCGGSTLCAVLDVTSWEPADVAP